MADVFDWPLSDGEINFLWWFIQGSIMNPPTRWRLRLGWGFCERHAWGALAVEAAFRHGYLHGSAVLYHDLMERAVRSFSRSPLWSARMSARRLRTVQPCLMCELKLRRASGGVPDRALIDQGQDFSVLQAMAKRTREYWQEYVCGRCAGDGSSARCRPHLIEEASRGRAGDLDEHRSLVEKIASGVAVFERSFHWEYHGTGTDEYRAALIGAVGWCSGWQAGLAIIG